MDYTAQLRHATTSELVMTGTSDGKSKPEYEFEPGLDEDIAEAIDLKLDEAYDKGIYSKGSVGEVRDMLAAMLAVVDEFQLYVLKVPASTTAKAEKEAEAFIKSLPENAVF